MIKVAMLAPFFMPRKKTMLISHRVKAKISTEYETVGKYIKIVKIFSIMIYIFQIRIIKDWGLGLLFRVKYIVLRKQ